MTVYDDYNAFALAHFNKAADQQLMFDHVGSSDLAFVPAGFWLHPSRTSACIAFQTNLPAKGRVECASGQVPPEDEREFCLHIYHVTGLAQDSQHDYTIYAKRGQVEIQQSGSFNTSTPLGAVLISPADGNSITLNQNDTTYILTDDWDADRRAFTIHALRVTLDLDGHKITYDNLAPSGEDSFGIYCEYNLQLVNIRNGKIHQGVQVSPGPVGGNGMNPILSRSSVLDVRGIEARWAGANIPGIRTTSSQAGDVSRHNVLIDEGTQIDNRHQAVRAVDFEGHPTDVLVQSQVHHTLVKRCRHRGIDGRDDRATVTNCEVWQDSWATNAYGISARHASHNWSYVTGYWAGAFGWTKDPMHLHHNYVNGYGIPNERSDEYDRLGTVQGFRMTAYEGEGIDVSDNVVEDNTVILRCAEGAVMRGIGWSHYRDAKRNEIRRNVFKLINDDETPPDAGRGNQSCITMHGGDGAGQVPHAPVRYTANRCITNVGMVATGEGYGSGSNSEFVNCIFERVGTYVNFATVRNNFAARQSVDHDFHNTTLINCDLENPDYTAHSEGHERWYNVYPDGYQMRSTTEGMVKLTIETGREVLTEADDEVLLEDGGLLLLESASPLPPAVPSRPYIYIPRRIVGTRPYRFVINRQHSLARGLQFAQLGEAPSDGTAWDSARGQRAQLVGQAPFDYAGKRPFVRYDTANHHIHPWHAGLESDQYTFAMWVRTEVADFENWLEGGGPSTGVRRYLIGTNATQRMLLIMYGASIRTAQTAHGVIPVGSLSHVVWTYPGGDVAQSRLWLNNQEISVSGDGDPGALRAMGRGNKVGPPSAHAPCSLADVMQWNRLLSQDEIRILANRYDPMLGGLLEPIPEVYAIGRGDIPPEPPEQILTPQFDSLTIY